MANLNIAGATYGRDSAGTAALKNNLKGDIASARKALKGADYNRVLTTVRQYWSGADADRFYGEFKATVNFIDQYYAKLDAFIDTVFASDLKQFKQMQSNNTLGIKGKNIQY